MTRCAPTTATGESESGSAATAWIAEGRTSASSALSVAPPAVPVRYSGTRCWLVSFISLFRLRLALTTSFATETSRSAPSSIFSGWDFG